MKIYSNYNYSALNDKNLELDDLVVFMHNSSIYIYKVLSDHLSKLTSLPEKFDLKIPDEYTLNTSFHNRKIFNALSLDKEHFCNEYYGYSLHRGEWPCTEKNDYNSLTDLVMALFNRCNLNSVKKAMPPKPDPNFTAKETLNKDSINLNSKTNGKIIIVQPIDPQIIRGKERRGSIISGRIREVTVSIGYLSNREISV